MSFDSLAAPSHNGTQAASVMGIGELRAYTETRETKDAETKGLLID